MRENTEEEEERDTVGTTGNFVPLQTNAINYLACSCRCQ